MSASAPEPAFSPHTKVISPAKPAVLSSFVGPVTEKTVWLNRNVLSDAPPGYKDGIQWVKPDEMTMTMGTMLVHVTKWRLSNIIDLLLCPVKINCSLIF